MVDLAILVILGVAVLAGYYRGVVYSLISLGLTVLSFLLALVCIPALSGSFKANEEIYDMMLYYFEGYEYINDTSVELVHEGIDTVDDATLSEVITNANMPYPMDSAVQKNVRRAVYKAEGIETLGDYFNQTIVDLVINILSLLLLFIIFRLAFGFVLHLVDYGKNGLPVLARYDAPVSLGIGFLHGILLVFILFMLVPIVLTVVPKLESFLEGSVFGEFFYRGNLLLRLVPTT